MPAHCLRTLLKHSTAHTVPARLYLNRQRRNGSKDYRHSQERSHTHVESQRSHVVPKASLRSPMAPSVPQRKDRVDKAICHAPIEHALQQVDACLQLNKHSLSGRTAGSPSTRQQSSARSMQCCRGLVLPSTSHQCVALYPPQGDLLPGRTANQAAVSTDTAVQTCT